MRIYLVGLPGCGKSTLGKKLAEKIKVQNYKPKPKMLYL